MKSNLIINCFRFLRNNINVNNKFKSDRNNSKLSNNFLSYTFRAFHNKDKKNKKDVNEYIYDLENTLKINLDFVKEISLPYKLKNKSMNEKIEKIINLYNKRKEIRKRKKEIKSKILMNNQIIEEYKRRNEENLEFYSRQYKSVCDALEKKLILIKKYQKRFDEVESYIQKECILYPKFTNKFCDFQIISFLIENENLLLIKIELNHENNNLKISINSLYNENKELMKKENELSNEVNKSNNNKYEELIEKYKYKCDYESNKIKNLKNFLKNLKNKNAFFNRKNFFLLNNNFSEYFNSEKTLMSLMTNYNKNENFIISNMSRLTQNSNMKGWDVSYIEKKDNI